jgi:hypothetical protein
VTAKASEEHPAKKQQPESLPEGDLLPSEECGGQPVPQMHRHFAENCDKKPQSPKALQ